MSKSFGKLFLLIFAIVLPVVVPVAASADTLSVTQVITITATVPPMRSIVVNDEGQMTTIYSNTDEPVMPKVYLNKAPGPEKSLTPALLRQYNSIISNTKHLDGVKIPVALPGSGAGASTLSKILSKTVSTIGNPQLLWQ